LFHHACLKCSSCSAILSKKSGYYEETPGQFHCENCVQGDAKKELNSSAKMVECDECSEPISGTYFQYEGKNLCEKDYNSKRKSCHKCSEFISGSYYTTKDDQFICANCYKEQQGGSLSCYKCKEDITDGGIIRALDTLFHPQCFVCVTCDMDLSKGGSFLSDDEKNLYCKKDYHMKFAPKCGGCGEPIAPKEGETTTPRLKVLDKDWHPECFKCKGCESKLGGGSGKKCFPHENNPYCEDCIKVVG